MEGRHWARLHLKEIRIRFIRICFTPHSKESLEIVSFSQLYLTKCRSALSFQHLPFPFSHKAPTLQQRPHLSAWGWKAVSTAEMQEFLVGRQEGLPVPISHPSAGCVQLMLISSRTAAHQPG